MARPTEYQEAYVEMVHDYLNDCEDQYDSEKKEYLVKLPTVEGFADYVGHNKTTIYEWVKIYPEFSNAIDRIKNHQLNKLINKGLSGKYNATIAKLLLSGNHNIREKSEQDITSDGKALQVSFDPSLQSRHADSTQSTKEDCKE
jgi:hypothetical protein